MRSMMRKLTLLAAALLIMSVPVLAAEDTVGGMIDQGKQGKDECLIVAKNCPDSRADSLYQKVDRLRGEISRGTDVYTTDELNFLERKLEDAVKAAETAYENG